VKYAWIREQADSFPIAVMCRVLNVSSSGYYHWCDLPVRSPLRTTEYLLVSKAVKQRVIKLC
jgi:hypothetical protein